MHEILQELHKISASLPELPWAVYRKLNPTIQLSPWVPNGTINFIPANDVMPSNMLFMHRATYQKVYAMFGQDQFPPSNSELACMLLYVLDCDNYKANRDTICKRLLGQEFRPVGA